MNGCEQAASNARALLNKSRDMGHLIIHLQHISPEAGATFFIPGTSGVEINEMVAPLGGEQVVTKHYPNGFRKTALHEILKNHKIKNLTICGAMSHMCIDATTRAAYDLGFHCILAADACATKDLIFAGRTISANEVQASFMAALSSPYAKVSSTQTILQEMADQR